MKVTEIFYSLQGEGFLAGVPGVFIRLAGCRLRCDWCDTKYAWDAEAGRDLSIEQIAEEMQKFKCENIVITGGEPTIDSDLPRLVQKLKASNKHITIETAGSEFVADLDCDLMSISPKLSNAGQPNALNVDVLNRLIAAYDYQLKFVVECENDIAETEQVLNKLEHVDRAKVMLMPQAATRSQYLERAPLVADLCLKYDFAFSPRLHVMLWDNERGR